MEGYLKVALPNLKGNTYIVSNTISYKILDPLSMFINITQTSEVTIQAWGPGGNSGNNKSLFNFVDRDSCCASSKKCNNSMPNNGSWNWLPDINPSIPTYYDTFMFNYPVKKAPLGGGGSGAYAETKITLQPGIYYYGIGLSSGTKTWFGPNQNIDSAYTIADTGYNATKSLQKKQKDKQDPNLDLYQLSVSFGGNGGLASESLGDTIIAGNKGSDSYSTSQAMGGSGGKPVHPIGNFNGTGGSYGGNGEPGKILLTIDTGNLDTFDFGQIYYNFASADNDANSSSLSCSIIAKTIVDGILYGNINQNNNLAKYSRIAGYSTQTLGGILIYNAGTKDLYINKGNFLLSSDLPTYDPNVYGQLWDNNGVVMISTGTGLPPEKRTTLVNNLLNFDKEGNIKINKYKNVYIDAVLPTEDTGIDGQLWNNNNVLMISTSDTKNTVVKEGDDTPCITTDIDTQSSLIITGNNIFIDDLPTEYSDIPGQLWNNGNVVCIDEGDNQGIQNLSDAIIYNAITKELYLDSTNFLLSSDLPTYDPNVSGQLWNNGDVVMISTGTGVEPENRKTIVNYPLYNSTTNTIMFDGYDSVYIDSNLPTEDTGIDGQLWNNNNVLMISTSDTKNNVVKEGDDTPCITTDASSFNSLIITGSSIFFGDLPDYANFYGQLWNNGNVVCVNTDPNPDTNNNEPDGFDNILLMTANVDLSLTGNNSVTKGDIEGYVVNQGRFNKRFSFNTLRCWIVSYNIGDRNCNC